MARLWAAAAVDWSHSVKSSVALLFIDLSSAFASIVREVVLPMPTSADQLAHRLLARGLPHEAVARCMESTQAYDGWVASGDRRHLSAMLASSHLGSWFSMDTIDSIWHSKSGSLAGSSLGDLISCLSLAR